MGIIGIIVLLLTSIIYFFSSNSIVAIKVVATSSLSTDTATVLFDNKKAGNITVGSSKIFIINRSVKRIQVSTDRESSIQPYSAPHIYTALQLTLQPQSAIRKLARPIIATNNCAYLNTGVSYSWQCNSPELQLEKTDYTAGAYPRTQEVPESTFFTGAVPYRSGFLSLSNGDRQALMFVDLSKEGSVKNPKVVNVSNTITFDSRIYIDQSRPESFIIIDATTKSFTYFKDSIDHKPTEGKLAFKDDVALFSRQYSLLDGNLVSYYGTNSLDATHGKDVKPSETMSVSTQNLTTNSVTKVELGKAVYCDTTVFIEKYMGCSNSSYSRFFSTESGKQVGELEKTGGVFSGHNTLLVPIDNKLYRYNPALDEYQLVWSVANQNISSVILSGDALYISTLFSQSYGNQIPQIFSLDLTKNADYAQLEYKLPITQKSLSPAINEIDYFNSNIFVNTSVKGSYSSYNSVQLPQKDIDNAFLKQKDVIKKSLVDYGIDTEKYKLNYYY